MEEKKEDISGYIRDLKEMKDLISRNEEKPFVEYWDFLNLGVLIILGTILHALFFPEEIDRALLVIWLPILIICGVVETVAWFYAVNRLQTAISARRNKKFYLALLVLFVAVSVVFYFLIHLNGPIPGMFLLLLSILFSMIAQMTYMALFIETMILLVAGIILTFLDGEGLSVMAGTGIFAGLMFIVLGVHTRILEKRNG